MKLLLLSTLTLLASTTAHSFTLTSSGSTSSLKGWSGGNVQLALNSSNCPAGIDVQAMLSDAAAVWNNSPESTVSVSYAGSTSSTTYGAPVTVYCATNFNAITGADENSVPAAASTQAPGGQLTKGLLVLNASPGTANIAGFDGTSLRIIVAHEIGHVLGLGHSTTKNALMYYDASAKKQLKLSQDDIDGITYLYPTDEFSKGKIMGCGLVRNLPPPPPGSRLLVLLLALAPLLVLLKLRSARKHQQSC